MANMAFDHNELEGNFDWLVFEFEVPVRVKRIFWMKRHQVLCRLGSVAILLGLDMGEGINNVNV